MDIKYNVTGDRRKELVKAVSDITGGVAEFKFAPTFSYVVNNFTIDKRGTISFDERVKMEEARTLIEGLAEKGFASEDDFNLGDSFGNDTGITAAGSSVEEIINNNTSNEDSALVKAVTESELNEAAPAEDVPTVVTSVIANTDKLIIEMPLEGFTEATLDNLNKLVSSKASLIMKAIGADSLPIIKTEGTLCFPWFASDKSTDEFTAYAHFVSALCTMAKNQKRVTAKEKPMDKQSSEKFAFRCFLLRLGFIGDEYKATRKVLLANLPGDGSFKSGKRVEQDEDTPVAAYNANSDEENEGAITGRENEDNADNAVTGDGEGAYAYNPNLSAYDMLMTREGI